LLFTASSASRSDWVSAPDVANVLVAAQHPPNIIPIPAISNASVNPRHNFRDDIGCRSAMLIAVGVSMIRLPLLSVSVPRHSTKEVGQVRNRAV
jgi:hypothetical protein